MAAKTSKKSATAAKKAAAKRVAARAAKPRKAVAKSSDHISASERIDKKIADYAIVPRCGEEREPRVVAARRAASQRIAD